MKHDAHKLVFIGAGNMAEALIKGVLHKSMARPEDVAATDVNGVRLEYIRSAYGVETFEQNAAGVRQADVLFLAVKPQSFGEVLPEIAEHLDREKTLVISIAAGISTARIEAELGEGTRVVRVMPNIPALVGFGAAGVCAGRWATGDDLARAEDILGAVGVAARVEESQMDAVTAVSGSGPAYVFYLIEAMQEAAKELGLNENTARRLILMTVRGAAELCESSGEPAALLRERVTSKGGTTSAALAVMNERGVKNHLVEAMRAARDRSKELSGAQD